jgi:sigma-B regulation protein RsbU (phosphoserine phosphatase)
LLGIVPKVRPFSSIPRSLLLGLAILYAAATVVYSGSWAFYIRAQRRAQAGLNFERNESRQQTLVTEVVPVGPAQKAGFQVGDNILEVNHRPLVTLKSFYDAVWRGQPGDRVAFAVRRPGVPSPITLTATLDPIPPAPARPPAQQFASQLLFSYQVPFVVVGLAVLFLRLDSREAWLLALVFGGFIAGSPLLIVEPLIHPALRGFALAYMVAARGMLPALLYYFFATFPVSSPIERRVPWLKRVILVASAVIVIPLSLWAWLDGGSRPLALVEEKVGPTWTGVAVVCYFFGVTGLALISLVANSLSTPSADARRKIRVILWGMLCGLGPFLTMSAVSVYTRTEYWTFPFWIWVPTALSLCLVPIAFAYAVVKHRVLEIPVLLKRSARYVLVQRGFLVLLFVAAATAIAVFTHIFARFLQADSNVGMTLSAVFGIVLVWSSAPLVKKGTERIDRAFFRSAYDVRVILQDLAEKTRTVTDRHELANLLEIQIKVALHPKSLACYLEAGDGNLVAECGPVPRAFDTIPAALPRPKFPFRFGALFVPRESDTIPATLPLLTEIAQRGKAWDVPQGFEAVGDLGPLAPECLVPILGRNSRLIGLLILGQRLSEESYSSEDKHLLDSVASQAGITLENIDLAEKMAERMEAERRAAMEIDIARRVQARLFPQNLPPLETLEYVGGCVQARQVGGDYYDFLNMRPGVVGIVLADISGKGMSAALLMANLQANLRGQYAVALDDLPRLLRSVNRLFYENTTDESYATMFFGVYDDSCRSLRFANCGHIAPLILRTDGSIQRLTSTTTVLGLFLKWESPIEEEKLHPGDLLVICTDGVTEAPNPQGQEYGEVRLAELIQENRNLPVNELLAAVQANVQEFSGATQADDITLIVARCH